MKAKNIFPIVLMVFALISCQDWYTEKLLDHTDAGITEVRNVYYTLTDADYKNIADNQQNEQLALSADDDSASYNALKSVAKLKYFPQGVDADVYIPAFLKSSYPHYSTGSFLNVTYRVAVDMPTYLADFANMSELTLNDVFTPATIGTLPSKLGEGEDGEIKVVNYKYQDVVVTQPATDTTIVEQPVETIYNVTEMLAIITALPTSDKTTEEYVCKGKIVRIDSIYYESYGNARFYISTGVDTLYCFDLFYLDSAKFESADQLAIDDSVVVKGKVQYYNMITPEFVRGGKVINHYSANQWKRMPRRMPQASTDVLTKIYQYANSAWKEYSHDGVNIISIPDYVYAQQGSVVLQNADQVIPSYLRNTYPYAAADVVYVVIYRADNGLMADEYIYDGGQWNKTLDVEEQTLAFENKNGVWEANISLYLSEPFTDGQGSFTIQDVLLTDPLTYVWKFDTRYGMKATAYVGGNHESESWIVSPTLKFKNAIDPVLSFDQASKYAADFTNELFVMVSTDYAGDVTTATWTHIPFNQNEDGDWIVPDGSNWDFIPTGELSLSQFVGEKVTIGFKYTSSDAASATWEIKNVIVQERPTEE